jgi:hypothetical protein
MRRLAVVGVGLALSAGAIGVAVGFVLDDHQAPRAATAARELRVSSTWVSNDRDRHLRVVSGAFAADPRRGFVLLARSERWIDQRNPERESKRFVQARPLVFTSADRSGPLHIVTSSDSSWILDSSGGSRSVLELVGEGGPLFFTLGRRLDPVRLPRLTAHGLAVPIVYGPSRRKAVLLVGRESEATWRLYGYLPGFSLPQPGAAAERFARPLLGPDRALYRVDAVARRLVRAGTAPRQKAPSYAIPPRCSTWETALGSFRTCPDSVGSLAGDGSVRTLYRLPGANALAGRWTFLAPSADGKRLLLEYSVYACGTSRQAFFLPVGGGSLQPAVADASSQSEPLGWLSDGAALVAAQSSSDCEGASSSGIYQSWPGVTSPASQLVVATSGQDATLWGPAG